MQQILGEKKKLREREKERERQGISNNVEEFVGVMKLKTFKASMHTTKNRKEKKK